MRVTEKVGTMDRSPRRPMPSSPPCSWASTTQLQGHCGGSGTVSRCASHACPQGVAPATRTVGPKAALWGWSYEQPVCANSGRSAAPRRTGQVDPLQTFEIDPVNGR